MKIVVVSDTHICGEIKDFPGNLLDDIKSADLVIHTGDFTEVECFQSLKALAKDLQAVHGNMDSEELKKRLPAKSLFNVGGYKIAITHGSGAPLNIISVLSNAFKADNPDIIIFGHTHTAFNKKINDTLYFNPGSLFDRFYAEFNSYGIIEINGGINARIVKINNA
ncbi:MAG: metallophosphoesterase family protein [Candidatus Omnitrophota bacterium]